VWNTFVSTAHNATFLFHRDFMEYHQERFQDNSLLIFNKGSLVALLPAHINDTVLSSHQGLTYGGIITQRPLRMDKSKQLLEVLIEYLQVHGVTQFNWKYLPSIYTLFPNDNFLYLLYQKGATIHRMDTLSVLSLQQNFKISKDRREGVKRGRKHALKIEETDDFSAFWNDLLIPNLQRKYQVAPVHSLKEIQYLNSKFPKQIRLFVVCHEDELVAGTVIFDTPHVAHSQYIASNVDKNTLGSLDFLHYHLITDVFAHKIYFDFGTSNEDQGKKINTGLQYWKEGFGSHTLVQHFLTLEI